MIGFRGAGTRCEPHGAATLQAKDGGLEDGLLEERIVDGEGRLQGFSETCEK